ncbi:hypothetical protein BDZ45DRAFT_35594 [Acephala macrosclerotiorum]|nr:hypothetical protein BDZ45DRAFT_35594 [Acephala macrosclerotiorum]
MKRALFLGVHLFCIIGTTSLRRLYASVFGEAQGSHSTHGVCVDLGLACLGTHGILALAARILLKLSRRFVLLVWPGTCCSKSALDRKAHVHLHDPSTPRHDPKADVAKLMGHSKKPNISVDGLLAHKNLTKT